MLFRSITGDLELLGEAIMDTGPSRAKVSAFVLSWVGYAGGALLGALGAVAFPHHGFLPSMMLAVASLIAVMLLPERPRPRREQ